jgi:hypothetical protein
MRPPAEPAAVVCCCGSVLQELSFYRSLGVLVKAVHEGAIYCPLTDTHISSISDTGGLTASSWSPLITPRLKLDSTSGAAGGRGSLATSMSSLSLAPGTATAADSGGGGGGVLLLPGSGTDSSSGGDGSGRAAAAAAAARLRSALQRLCGAGGPGRGWVGGVNAKPPLWLYINHLGWCRWVALSGFVTNMGCY